MKENLYDYIAKYIEITPEIQLALEESTFARSFKKGSLLLKEGEIANECYFIFNGCIRSYYLKDGEEKTTEIYTEEQAVAPPNYGTGEKSKMYLECIEDTVVTVGTPELEKIMFEKYPALESLARVINDRLIANQKEAFDFFKMESPEERYLSLLKNRPDLFQRVPQHQIASYLGIKPESLSRIRKRIVLKERLN